MTTDVVSPTEMWAEHDMPRKVYESMPATGLAGRGLETEGNGERGFALAVALRAVSAPVSALSPQRGTERHLHRQQPYTLRNAHSAPTLRCTYV
jgi:hypothetical protein